MTECLFFSWEELEESSHPSVWEGVHQGRKGRCLSAGSFIQLFGSGECDRMQGCRWWLPAL